MTAEVVVVAFDVEDREAEVAEEEAEEGAESWAEVGSDVWEDIPLLSEVFSAPLILLRRLFPFRSLTEISLDTLTELLFGVVSSLTDKALESVQPNKETSSVLDVTAQEIRIAKRFVSIFFIRKNPLSEYAS